jgi:hypothetical protein
MRPALRCLCSKKKKTKDDGSQSLLVQDRRQAARATHFEEGDVAIAVFLCGGGTDRVEDMSERQKGQSKVFS